jgi:hypothetical protein
MGLFSQRKGFKPVRDTFQKDSMSPELRNGLWSAILMAYLQRDDNTYSAQEHHDKLRQTALIRLWVSYFKRPLDTLRADSAILEIRDYFFHCEWYEVYDFLEYMFFAYEDKQTCEIFARVCNAILERELSAYRFVDGNITEITSDQEIEEIEAAVRYGGLLTAVSTHMKTALKLFSHRDTPDYRNSIKESISAVEAVCKLIAGKPKATLGQALDIIEKQGQIDLHPALRKSYENLYGYSSDAHGIRHAMLDKPDIDADDAKFMLVSCSAFTNYLVAKAEKAGIKLQP